MGIIAICFLIAKKTGDKLYTVMGWMVILSFAFYIPVVLFADAVPLIGMLMIPKTLAYVGVVVIGLVKFRRARAQQEAAEQRDALPAEAPQQDTSDQENSI